MVAEAAPTCLYCEVGCQNLFTHETTLPQELQTSDLSWITESNNEKNASEQDFKYILCFRTGSNEGSESCITTSKVLFDISIEMLSLQKSVNCDNIEMEPLKKVLMDIGIMMMLTNQIKQLR